MTRTCEVDGCDHPCYYPGYCIRHTERTTCNDEQERTYANQEAQEMTHNIKLNYDTDLNFKIVSVQFPEAVSRVVYSREKGRFIDIETTRSQGYVDVTNDDPTEWIAEIDGQRVYEHVTFDATEYEYPEGVRTVLWEVYSISTTGIEDDLEIEDVPTSDIPDAVVDMLL